jgi:hypothetical protein
MCHIMTVRTSETSSAMSCGARENSFSPAHVTVKFLCCAIPPDAAALFGKPYLTTTASWHTRK